MNNQKFSEEVLNKVQELIKNRIKPKKLNLSNNNFMLTEEYKKSYENYLKERQAFLMNYSVKYEWKNENSFIDKGPISFEKFVEFIKDDVVFAKKWYENQN